MNRVKRDYCSKGIHPKWKLWEAKYDMRTTKWSWVGNFCTGCGEKISSNDTLPSGPPHQAAIKRISILRGTPATYRDYEKEISRVDDFIMKRSELFRRLRNKK